MNQCVFLGEVDTVSFSTTDGVKRVLLRVEVENRRKKSGKKDIIETELLEFEAWDTAADTIYEYAGERDLVLLECTARHNSPFRINRFRILQNVEDFESED